MPSHGDSFAGYCGCCGVVVGGVVVGASVGGDAGRRYHTRISARTAAATIISTLLVSIANPHLLCPRLQRPGDQNKFGDPVALNENHKCAPYDHCYFGNGSPFRRSMVFVRAPENSHHSSKNVRERAQKEAHRYDIG